MSTTSMPNAGGTAPTRAPAASPASSRNPALRGPVLLAIHGRERSRNAMLTAATLARRLQRPLRVVTVVDPTPIAAPFPWGPPPTIISELGAAQETAVRDALRAALDDADWSLDVRYGSPPAEIRQAALEADATVLVVDAAFGSRKRGAAGVRALQILRGVTCPVLSVAAGRAGLARRALVGIDFSPASIRAAQTALLLLDDHATLVLAHVAMLTYTEHPVREPSGAILGGDPTLEFQRVRDELAPYTPDGVTIETIVVSGDVADEILFEIDTRDADLVAVGTRGAGIVQRLFVGSTASGLLHHSPCSVLVAPAPPPAEFARLELRVGETTVVEKKEAFPQVLAAAFLRNDGRMVTMEVDDPALGAQLQATGYGLRGLTYEPRTRDLEIMIGDARPHGVHLTRRITGVDAVSITARDGRDRAIAITHGRAKTLVIFDD